MTDHVCAWAAASPARYRASSSSKAASMSSRSNMTRAAIRFVGVDLDDAEQLGVERLGPLIAARGTETMRARRSPRVAMTVDVTFCDPDFGDGSHVRDVGISTVSDPGVHDPTAIVDGNVVGQYLRHGVPVAGREVRPEALVHLACRVFQPRRRRLSSSNLASAASRSASSKISQRLIRSPSTVRMSIIRHSASKPSCEVPCAAWVTTAPRSLSRCTASM